MIKITEQDIGKVITSLAASFESELMAKTESELANDWFFVWDEKTGIEWNIYHFSDMLEMHRFQCRKWEDLHNGGCCVVERVRDKYLMPRVREFLLDLRRHI